MPKFSKLQCRSKPLVLGKNLFGFLKDHSDMTYYQVTSYSKLGQGTSVFSCSSLYTYLEGLSLMPWPAFLSKLFAPPSVFV